MSTYIDGMKGEPITPQPTNNTQYLEDDELRKAIKKAQLELVGRRATHLQVARKSGWTPTELDEVHDGDQIIFENDIMQLIKARDEQRERKYEDIFKWLFGEAGDFPVSQPGKRYSWRTELRKRLALTQSPKKKGSE